MIKLKYILVFLIIGNYLNAQNTEIQSFTYESTTRDTVVTFPEGDHNQWERIWMMYSMRCKDGLVSPGQTGLTNLGCGEWDYSCNTYVVDSTQLDSVRRTAPSHVISNFSDLEFPYTSLPTYTYYSTDLHNVEYTMTTDESVYTVNDGDAVSDIFKPENSDAKRFQVLFTSQELLDAGLTVGNISGLKLNVESGSGLYKRLKVSIQNFAGPLAECRIDEGMIEVYGADTELSSSNNFLKFYNDFDWDGGDLLVEFSFINTDGDVVLKADTKSEISLISQVNTFDKYIHSSGTGSFSIENGLETFDKEITIAVWHYGDSQLPINSTLLEATNDSGNRQVNIHLPWSNGQVYWDCGGDGGSYDRLNKQASDSNFKDQWNHWAFTKNAATGQLRIYLNGELWINSTGNYRTMNIKNFKVLENVAGTNKNYSRIDDLSIWNTALNGDEIADLMCTKITEDHPDFANLVAYYDFDSVLDSNNNTISDISVFANNAAINGEVNQNRTNYFEVNKYNTNSSLAPSMSFVRGTYTKDIEEVTVLDSIPNNPHKVEFYTVENNSLVLDKTEILYQAIDQSIFNENGDLSGVIPVTPEGELTITTLNYFAKTPMALEIMSFVTPYGINLDLGIQGKTWAFDVTDFGPILKGDRRIYLTRGGQWQEDMDIKFVFVPGTPARPVNSIQQLWPVTSENYQTIQADNKFEPRIVSKGPEDAYVLTKTTVTGHGQEGEFIPREHYISLDGIPFSWQVWKECAENPIYPQGGTWVYDRAGWCPGAASDTYVADFTYFFFEDEPAEVDYGVNGGSGDSRYIVSSQMIKYGEASFESDAAMEDIIYPSTKIEYGRFNPNCGNPKVLIKNNGINNLGSATIEYGVEGGEVYTYNWSGNLEFLETREVDLPYISDFSAASSSKTFYAKIKNPNGGNDEYSNNDMRTSSYRPVDFYTKDIIINIKTNGANNETGYKVYDENGNVILSRGPNGLNPNTYYYDTLTNLQGCYKILVSDSGNDGLDWWANNDGQGFLRLRSINGAYKTIATDFGKFIDYNLVAGEVSGIEDLSYEYHVDAYPNPFTNEINVIAEGFDGNVELILYDQMGRNVHKETIVSNDKIINNKLKIKDIDNGFYYLSIRDRNKHTMKKLIKMR
jgi:hypothetical protein